VKRIKLKHFPPDPDHCAVSASSVVVNYYNKNLDYIYVKNIAYKKISKQIIGEGLDAPQTCMLLNYIGFKKVTLITSDFAYIDYEWRDYGKKNLKNVLKNSIKNKKDKKQKETVENLYKWCNLKKYKNILKIDYDFSKYIKKHLNKKKPVILSFNWTMFFKFAQEDKFGEKDPINGDFLIHAVVANGYDANGVWIVDSYHDCYKYKRKKYRRGFYKMKWEHLLPCMGQGDVILADDYIKDY
jgi:hypothetical protein